MTSVRIHQAPPAAASPWLRAAPHIAAFALALLAFIVLVGWQFGIERLKRIMPMWVAMNPATAICFIAASFAISLSAASDRLPQFALPTARWLASLIALFGFLRVLAVLGGPDLHLDQQLYNLQTGTDAILDQATRSNRVAPNTALLFLLTGSALFVCRSERRALRLAARAVALLAAFISLVAIVGYFNGVSSLYKPTVLTPMALHTAMGFLLLAAGLFLADPNFSTEGIEGGLGQDLSAVRRKVTVGFGAALFLLALIGVVSNASMQAFANTTNEADRSSDVFMTQIAITVGIAVAFVLVGSAGWLVRRDLAQKQIIAEELRQAHVAAQAANESKGHFLANMSHEIRTPMTAIIGYADLIMDPNQTPSDRLEYVNTIRRNGEHLLTIINDILDLSKIDAGKLQVDRTECVPCQVLSDVASLMRVRAAEKHLKLEIRNEGPVPATIRSDPARLRQILINLLGNAIKFTEEGWVRLIMKLDESGASPRLCFAVIDTGIGMTGEQIGRLFQPFVQADETTTRRFGGTGLGLTICKRLAEMLGGRIEVDSSPGRGSTFSLVIDTGPLEGVRRLQNCREALAGTERVSTAPQTTAFSASVLLVDDGEDNRRLLSVYLSQAGATVTLAENGRIGVDKALAAAAAGKPFDVILMDMQMPVLDGYGAASLLRTRGYTRPIIALTANAMAEDCDKCLNAGCTDYLSKPVHREQLLLTVARHLDRSALPAAKVEPVAASPATPRPGDAGAIRSVLNDESLQHLLDAYLAELPLRAADIEAALAKGDFQKLSSELHNLKGTGGLYGLMPITEAAGSIEQMLRQNAAMDSITAQVAELVAMIQRVEGVQPAERQRRPADSAAKNPE